MKYTDLIKGQWYSGTSNHYWVFKFLRLQGINTVWCTVCGNPIDGYISHGEGSFYQIQNIKVADMEEVFRLFPEEKELFKNQYYEIY